MWTRFRKQLNRTDIVKTNRRDWKEYINNIDNLIPEKISWLIITLNELICMGVNLKLMEEKIDESRFMCKTGRWNS